MVVAGLEVLTDTVAAAATVVRAVSLYGYGHPLSNYVSAISGPSRTGDIEFKLVPGMHGPKKVHVVLLDNGRAAAAAGERRAALCCLHCGACLDPADLGRSGPARDNFPGQNAVLKHPPAFPPYPPWPYSGAAGRLWAALLGGGQAGVITAPDSFTGCPLGIDVPGMLARG